MSDPASLSLSIVVFGASRSGKTTLLRGIHERLGAGNDDSGPTRTQHFLPLDWVSLDLGTIGGRAATVLLYAVPGVVAFDATRRVLIHGADGVIFVADSQASRLDDNLAARSALRDHLAARSPDHAEEVPVAYFYSKRDLPAELLVAPEMLDQALGIGTAPRTTGDAVRGDGVREVLQGLLTLMLRRVSGIGTNNE